MPLGALTLPSAARTVQSSHCVFALHMTVRPPEQDAALNLLILATNADEATQIAAHFDGATFSLVTDATGLRTALREGPWDAALYLFNLAGLTPAGALKVLQGLDVDLPFIVIADP